MWQPAEPLRVTPQDRTLMQEYLRCGSAPQKIVFRMRIVLAAAEGQSNNEVAKKLETTRPTVLHRPSGKIAFSSLVDSSGRIQLFEAGWERRGFGGQKSGGKRNS